MASISQVLRTALECHQKGLSAQAESICRQVLSFDPRNTDALGLLAVVCQARGRLDEAIGFFQQALQLNPQLFDVLNNLGYALRIRGDLEEAEAVLQEALRLRPEFVLAQVNLATVFKFQGRIDDAVALYRVALAAKPDFAEAHVGLGIALLLQGNLEQGWPEYEWRWRRSDFGSRPRSQAHWGGTPLNGRTILLHCEQGLGDSLQFIRFAPLVKRGGGTVLVQCQDVLVRLIESCAGVDRVVLNDSPSPQCDVSASLLSLPALLKTTLADIPAAVPYLRVAPERVDYWRGVLAGPQFKVGIAWQGNSNHQADHHRSFALTCFAPVAAIPGVRLISLQKGFGAEQVQTSPFEVMDLAGKITDDFVETAAIIENLDLVITADTALAHLAGALGAPVWVVLPLSPDWRWQLERPDSPWYPTMRLFRRQKKGDWGEVFDRIGTALRTRVESSREFFNESIP